MKEPAEGSAAKGTQNYTEQNIAQNEKKAREIVQWSWVTFPVTATLGKTRGGRCPNVALTGLRIQPRKRDHPLGH